MDRDRAFLEVAARLSISIQRSLEAGLYDEVIQVRWVLGREFQCIRRQLGISQSLFEWAVIQKARELQGLTLIPLILD